MTADSTHLFSLPADSARVVLGEMGDPVPSLLSASDSVHVIVLATFCLYALLLGHYHKELWRFSKAFFYGSYSNYNATETQGESAVMFRALFSLALLDCVVLAFTTYLRAVQVYDDIFPPSSSYLADILQLTLFFVAFTLLRWLLYTGVNLTFFDAKKNLQWRNAFFFTMAFEGLLLYPLVVLAVYLNLSVNFVLFFTVLFIVLVKIVLFYKGFCLFFKEKASLLQFFLYICTLEMVPVAAFVGVINITIGIR